MSVPEFVSHLSKYKHPGSEEIDTTERTPAQVAEEILQRLAS